MSHSQAKSVHIPFIVFMNSDTLQITHNDSRGQQRYVCEQTHIFDCCLWRLNESQHASATGIAPETATVTSQPQCR